MTSKILAPLFFIFVFISCSSDDDGLGSELNSNRVLWQSSQIKNYSMNERLSCFCGGLLEWDVYIKDGIKEKVEFDESQLPQGQTYDDIFINAKKVEEAFDFIEDLINHNVASLVVEYNNEYGFPSLISIDYARNTADDEIAYLYTDFEIIN